MNKLKDRAKKLKTDIPAVFLALKDKQTPWYAKILAAIIVVYALSPMERNSPLLAHGFASYS